MGDGKKQSIAFCLSEERIDFVSVPANYLQINCWTVALQDHEIVLSRETDKQFGRKKDLFFLLET